MEILHPAAAEERIHLTETLAVVEREQGLAEAELAQAARKLDSARRDDPDGVPLREMMWARSRQLTEDLARAGKRPYFTRVDFIPAGGSGETYYIGRWGVMESKTLKSVVVDWRAPIANLYYSGQVGPMRYEAPDGVVEGELTLKRQLTVEGGELKGIFDTDVAARDAYLQSVLGAMTGQRLKDIVTSIQAEQNFVIRHPLNRNLVVQGVAGSGKTTIALHRIAYLLYAFSGQLRPDQMLILAPNPLFLTFISGVLPDLGVENARQSTFPRFLAESVGSPLPRLFDAPPSPAGAFKGSLECVKRLEAFLDEYEAGYPPEGIFKFGPAMLFDREQLRKFLLEDEKPFPLERRKKEFEKELRRRLKAGLEKTLAWLDDECERRSNLLERMTSPGEERARRMRALYQSRDQRKEEARQRARTYPKDAMNRFMKLSPAQALSAFWESLKEESGPAGDAARESLALGKNTREDAALLALCDMRMFERPRLDVLHIVIDEAQDFSCAELYLLTRLAPRATFTIVGDLMQGIRAWRGMRDWDDAVGGVFGGRCVTHHLTISYRNTVEIMETAMRPALRYPVPGQRKIQPVLRHGPQPEFIPFRAAAEQARAIGEIVRKWTSEGMKTAAVIARDEKEARALSRELGYPLMNVEDEEYRDGPRVVMAAQVKGFEFDGVIVSDAGVKNYAPREEDARLLFVCLTRPLHRLAVLYSGELTPLLAEAES